ncbi:MAG TPA: hypothetical protein VN181_01740, partial [Thermoanaerobaculia bacterium]|nr:hypothetical protein [Thermoanaerobaculia bacterium]
MEPERFQERDLSPSGMLQINTTDPVIQAHVKAEWNMLSRAEYDQIKDHWWASSTSSFFIYNQDFDKLRGVWVAVANGISTVYTLPAKNVTGQ